MLHLRTILGLIISIGVVLLSLKTCNGKPVSPHSTFTDQLPQLPLLSYLTVPVLCDRPVTGSLAKSEGFRSNASNVINEDEQYDRRTAKFLASSIVNHYYKKSIMTSPNFWFANQRFGSLDHVLRPNISPYFGVPYNFQPHPLAGPNRVNGQSNEFLLLQNILETLETSIRQCQVRSYAQYIKNCCRKPTTETTTSSTTQSTSSTPITTETSTPTSTTGATNAITTVKDSSISESTATESTTSLPTTTTTVAASAPRCTSSCDGACGATSDQGGEFWSKDWPNNYVTKNFYCIYQIYAPAGMNIEFNLLTNELSPSNDDIYMFAPNSKNLASVNRLSSPTSPTCYPFSKLLFLFSASADSTGGKWKASYSFKSNC